MLRPQCPQLHVINHLTGEVSEGENRNVLVEAARICRGQIRMRLNWMQPTSTPCWCRAASAPPRTCVTSPSGAGVPHPAGCAEGLPELCQSRQTGRLHLHRTGHDPAHLWGRHPGHQATTRAPPTPSKPWVAVIRLPGERVRGGSGAQGHLPLPPTCWPTICGGGGRHRRPSNSCWHSDCPADQNKRAAQGAARFHSSQSATDQMASPIWSILPQQGTQTLLPGNVLVAQLMVSSCSLLFCSFSSSSSIFSKEMLSTADCTLDSGVAQGLLVT